MKIAIGADHAGFHLKEYLRKWLLEKGHSVTDCGTFDTNAADYPDLAALVAKAVQSDQANRGILVCSTGVGMSIAANKFQGIRAAVGVNHNEVRLIRAHNDANILTLGDKLTNAETATALVEIFLDTEFDGGRHARRLAKISALERDNLASSKCPGSPT